MGDTWTESTPTFTQVTATLKILGGDADIDNFLKSTRSNLQDLEAAVVQLKAKALQTKFEDSIRTHGRYKGDEQDRKAQLSGGSWPGPVGGEGQSDGPPGRG